MMDGVSLALYVGKGKIGNWVIRKWTGSQESHCELVVDGLAYSSSIQDKGVRAKYIEWNPIHWASKESILKHYAETKDNKYALFWDTILRESVPDCYADLGYRTVSTNPCGEIPLCPYDSCRLLAINLYSYVKNPFTPHAYFDFELFKDHVGLAQRIMDDIIDLEMEKIDQILLKINTDPEDENVKHTELQLWDKIRTKTLKGRRTGVGTTAESDMLAA